MHARHPITQNCLSSKVCFHLELSSSYTQFLYCSCFYSNDHMHRISMGNKHTSKWSSCKQQYMRNCYAAGWSSASEILAKCGIRPTHSDAAGALWRWVIRTSITCLLQFINFLWAWAGLAAKRDMVHRLQQQLKSRDEMMFDMQAPSSELDRAMFLSQSQVSLTCKCSLRPHRKVTFDCKREVQRLRKELAPQSANVGTMDCTLSVDGGEAQTACDVGRNMGIVSSELLNPFKQTTRYSCWARCTLFIFLLFHQFQLQ